MSLLTSRQTLDLLTEIRDLLREALDQGQVPAQQNSLTLKRPDDPPEQSREWMLRLDLLAERLDVHAQRLDAVEKRTQLGSPVHGGNLVREVSR